MPLGGAVGARGGAGRRAVVDGRPDARGQEHPRPCAAASRPSTAKRRTARTFVEFTAQTRMSGINLPDGTRLRKGAPDTVAKYVYDQGGTIPEGYQRDGRRHRLRRADAPGRRRERPARRRGQARRHPQARHPRTVRAAPADGPAGGDGHGRQPAHRQGDRRAGGRRRLHRPGHARGEARLHPQGAARAASSSP